MKLLNYFFYILTNFQGKTLGKNQEDSRFSSILLLGLWLAFVSLIPMSYIEKFHPNKITNCILSNALLFTVWGLICSGIMFIRYFRYIQYTSIVKWIESFNTNKSRLIYLIYLITFWGLLITSFIVYRIYLYNQVKWW